MLLKYFEFLREKKMILSYLFIIKNVFVGWEEIFCVWFVGVLKGWYKVRIDGKL